MKKKLFYIATILIFISANSEYCFADNFKEAEGYIRKSYTAVNQDDAYDYLLKAKKLYFEEYEANPINIQALIGLSKVNQLIQNRQEAKLYILIAYNMHPYDPKLQKEMGDFYYSFQEYSTAIEYYKLALSSGLLKDYATNIRTAECYEKLGDNENSELYYKISGYLNSDSKEAKRKINEYDSYKHPDDSIELENKRYKYMLRDKPISEEEQTNKEINEIIEKLNK